MCDCYTRFIYLMLTCQLYSFILQKVPQCIHLNEISTLTYELQLFIRHECTIDRPGE
jgi:hypothetical protein